MSDNLRVNELFTSIQGEGLWTGVPTFFLRLQGCNLSCSFCDTPRAISMNYHPNSVWHYKQLADHICVGYYPRRVCITGGEPMLQWSGVNKMVQEIKSRIPNYLVHIETNGTIPLTEEMCANFDWIACSPKGPNWDMNIPWSKVNEIKYIMGTEMEYNSDLDEELYPPMAEIQHAMLRMKSTNGRIWLQPDNNRPEAIEWCKCLCRELALEPGGQLVGLSLQIHKFMNVR